jgi:hypothetical protein
MAETQAGWYDDGSGTMRWWDGQKWTDTVQSAPPTKAGVGGMIDHVQKEAVSGGQPRPAPTGMSYVVLQVILKEKLWGTGSGNLTELEHASDMDSHRDRAC